MKEETLSGQIESAILGVLMSSHATPQQGVSEMMNAVCSILNKVGQLTEQPDQDEFVKNALRQVLEQL